MIGRGSGSISIAKTFGKPRTLVQRWSRKSKILAISRNLRSDQRRIQKRPGRDKRRAIPLSGTDLASARQRVTVGSTLPK